MHLRVARPVRNLEGMVAQYMSGLGLELLASFTNHEGFDGAMLGDPRSGYHFEFTTCRAHPVVPASTVEDLLVFHVPEPAEWRARCEAMRSAGFEEVRSFNPYWDRDGTTFKDIEGYRVVIQRAAWPDGLG